MGLGKRPVAKEKKTEKELKKERQAEVEQIVTQIRTMLRQEQGAAADSPEWKEFEVALTGFLNGDVKGNAAALSISLFDNIQTFAKGKKNFIESAKGQEIAKKLQSEMRKVPGATEDPNAAPLIHFLTRYATGEMQADHKNGKKGPSKQELEAMRKKGWVIMGEGPKTITVEEGKKEQKEAMEALRKLHKEMGIKAPEEIKKEQKEETERNPVKGMV